MWLRLFRSLCLVADNAPSGHRFNPFMQRLLITVIHCSTGNLRLKGENPTFASGMINDIDKHKTAQASQCCSYLLKEGSTPKPPDLGTINITEQVIATICGVAAMECYGLRAAERGRRPHRSYGGRTMSVALTSSSTRTASCPAVHCGGIRREDFRSGTHRARASQYAIENTLGLKVNRINVLRRACA